MNKPLQILRSLKGANWSPKLHRLTKHVWLNDSWASVVHQRCGFDSDLRHKSHTTLTGSSSNKLVLKNETAILDSQQATVTWRRQTAVEDEETRLVFFVFCFFSSLCTDWFSGLWIYSVTLTLGWRICWQREDIAHWHCGAFLRLVALWHKGVWVCVPVCVFACREGEGCPWRGACGCPPTQQPRSPRHFASIHSPSI